MKVSIILAPYDSGHRGAGFGLGPSAIIQGGLVEKLRENGHQVELHDIGETGDAQPREIATGFAVCNAVAEVAQTSLMNGCFPVVLSGNCLTTAGLVAAENADSIIWFDQHGDLNTPETSAYGFLDGMALATLLGLCWRPMANAIPGFRAIEPSQCVLVDARDLDPDEKEMLERLPIAHIGWENAPAAALKVRENGATRTHLHIDLDVLDPSVLRVNRYARPGGPTPDQLRLAASDVGRSAPIAGLTVSAYDPEFDAGNRIPPYAGRLIAEILAAIESSPC